jgi:hypothetical protein
MDFHVSRSAMVRALSAEGAEALRARTPRWIRNLLYAFGLTLCFWSQLGSAAWKRAT